MAKQQHKSGLHKEITAIFDGIRLPRHGEVPAASAPGQAVAVKQPVQSPAAPPEPPPVAPPEPPATPVAPPVVPVASPQTGASSAVVISGDTGLVGILAKVKSQFAGLQAKGGDGRQKVMLISIPVLLVALVFMLFNSLSPPAGQTAAAGPGIKLPARPVANTDINWKKPALYPTTAMLRDPMKITSRKTSDQTGEAPPIRGIMYSADKPSAIVGDQIMYVGDKISGSDIKVVGIKPDGVEFELNEKRWIQRVQ